MERDGRRWFRIEDSGFETGALIAGFQEARAVTAETASGSVSG
jgi:hypothetical protein